MTKPIARDSIYRRRRFEAEIIELCVRWYITYRLSYRDLVGRSGCCAAPSHQAALSFDGRIQVYRQRGDHLGGYRTGTPRSQAAIVFGRGRQSRSMISIHWQELHGAYGLS